MRTQATPVIYSPINRTSWRPTSVLRRGFVGLKKLLDRIAQQYNESKYAQCSSYRLIQTIDSGHHEAECVLLAPANATTCISVQRGQSPTHEHEGAPEEKKHYSEEGLRRSASLA